MIISEKEIRECTEEYLREEFSEEDFSVILTKIDNLRFEENEEN